MVVAYKMTRRVGLRPRHSAAVRHDAGHLARHPDPVRADAHRPSRTADPVRGRCDARHPQHAGAATADRASIAGIAMACWLQISVEGLPCAVGHGRCAGCPPRAARRLLARFPQLPDRTDRGFGSLAVRHAFPVRRAYRLVRQLLTRLSGSARGHLPRQSSRHRSTCAATTWCAARFR